MLNIYLRFTAYVYTCSAVICVQTTVLLGSVGLVVSINLLTAVYLQLLANESFLSSNAALVVISQNLHVWLGGLFVAAGYITATRQYVAQANSWSLEELVLKVTVSDKDGSDLKMDDCSFGIKGKELLLNMSLTRLRYS